MMSGTCIHFDDDDESMVDGQGSCMLYDDTLVKCIGWLSGKFCCIDYEPWEVIELVKW